ncbi:uncharacterized protein [Ranitomeya imitator]|uniref:uncharacterized protein isoform X2 n=1 Tax=Ranitomeya imitator TaxID=111125 RepID=UPI0037E77031
MMPEVWLSTLKTKLQNICVERSSGSHRFQEAEPEVDLFPAVICRLSVNLWEDDMAMALRILGLTAVYSSGLVILAAVQLSPGEVYVQRGSDITDCSMKCPHADGVLELYRICGRHETQLLELWCDNKWHYNRYQPRLLYNMSTGCWSLRNAGKDDSCVYKVVYYGDNGSSLTTLPVTVLGGVYVRRGSDITDCSMKCPHADGVLELYRICGGHETQLLELWCDNKWHYNRYQPRLLYNNSTGCWSLRDARKNDSCVYKVVYYGDNGRSLTTLPITVLDPVLISNITSNSSRPGEDIAVSVQFSGEGTAVTWEVDGGLLPDRYRLIDDNRTVIFPRPQRDDAERRFCVRITNPVSEEIREYQLEITDFPVVPVVVAVVVGVVVSVLLLLLIAFAVIFLYLRKKRTESRTEDLEMNGQGN